ncbi:MAG: ATP-dependent sacrificial sulfur transferase LarE [Candidatus Methylomirabilia bacterium]
MDVRLQAKYIRLVEIVRKLERVVVAFSGGVDSTLLARAAKDGLGERALLVTADSETYPEAELAEAKRLAQTLGMRHVVIRSRELDNPDYARNLANRCFFCKEELFDKIRSVVDEDGAAQVIYGANVDDLGDHRPGMHAARQMGIGAPLIEVGLTKPEIRELSRELGLSTWDKPSFACLSSRFPYGDPITVEKLRRVEAAEAFLRGLGFRQLRVRHHDTLARLEVPLEEVSRLWEDGRHEKIAGRFREIGYLYVAVDLQGFRSGSMNEVLQHRARSGLSEDGPSTTQPPA